MPWRMGSRRPCYTTALMTDPQASASHRVPRSYTCPQVNPPYPQVSNMHIATHYNEYQPKRMDYDNSWIERMGHQGSKSATWKIRFDDINWNVYNIYL